jgi:hypothetical protein
MTREILIDCEVRRYAPHASGFNGYIRAANYEVGFTATLLLNGRKSIVKCFNASFSENDLDHEERLAAIIISQFKQTRSVDIWDVPDPGEQIGDELCVTFTDTAKEVFEFLKNHSQKLIEAFKI